MSAKFEAVEWVRRVAERLDDMIEEVVFLGGSTTGLLITAPRTSAIRPTKDVDIIVEVATWGEYAQILDRLREKGFREDTEEGAPICRWVIDGIKVDVMPTKEEVLGFSNRWYQATVSAANTFQFSETLAVRLVSGPYFLATKFEAFSERGDGDYQLSHDIEDVVAVVDGRPELLSEIESADPEVREYLRLKVGELLTDEDFRSAVPGLLPGDIGSQARVPVVLARLEQIAGGAA
jgi:predicted nucleotidyltransferase